MPQWIIYGLVDPRTGEVRYIGKSCSGMRRIRAHTTPKALAIDDTPKGRWLRKLKRLGLRHTAIVLESSRSKHPLGEAEQRWIFYGRRMQWPLLNVTEGGDGAGHPTSEATREKIRQSKLGKPRPDLVGKPRPDVASRNHIAQSKETIERRIQARIGDNGLKGRIMPQAHRDKIADALRRSHARRRAEVAPCA